MNEYEFLKNMFHRLREMNEISERLKKDKPNSDKFNTAAVAIECSIKDYLELRGMKV